MQIAITGIGIVSALGAGKKANEENLLAGRSCISAPRFLQTVHREWPVGEVPLTNAELKQRLGKSADEEISRNTLLGMLAAREAMADAGVPLTEEALLDTAFINGTTVGGMDLTEQHIGEFFRGDMTHVDVLRQHAAAATTEAIAADLGGMSDVTTVSTACSSALNAIISGTNLIRTSEHPRALVGGTEALTRFHLNGFGSLGILSEQVCKPFQPDRDGINLGEGAAYLVLENAEAARARGAHIYGYIAGYANRCDAYHPTASSPDGKGAVLAMQDALNMAHLTPEKIDYINAHGTATPNNDGSEATAIEHVFGRPFNAGTWPEPLSTKNLTGHTTSASGSIEAIFCLMLMQARGYQRVMTNAFAFGGNDSSLILSAEQAEIDDNYPFFYDKDKDNDAQQLSAVLDDTEIDNYLTPMQKRRMSTGMRRLVVAVQKELKRNGLEKPGGIVVWTRWGCMQPTFELLRTLANEGEQNFSPSLFMQSTHNAPATTLAHFFSAHGFNATYAISDNFKPYLSVYDVGMTLWQGLEENIILCYYEDDVPEWRGWLEKAGMKQKLPVIAASTFKRTNNEQHD